MIVNTNNDFALSRLVEVLGDSGLSPSDKLVYFLLARLAENPGKPVNIAASKVALKTSISYGSAWNSLRKLERLELIRKCPPVKRVSGYVVL